LQEREWPRGFARRVHHSPSPKNLRVVFEHFALNYIQLHMLKPALPVFFRLAPEIKAAAEKAAADDHRSLSSLLEKILADYLKKAGYLKK
jgi:hypothetical protein